MTNLFIGFGSELTNLRFTLHNQGERQCWMTLQILPKSERSTQIHGQREQSETLAVLMLFVAGGCYMTEIRIWPAGFMVSG